eukprot:gene7411-539_t
MKALNIAPFSLSSSSLATAQRGVRYPSFGLNARTKIPLRPFHPALLPACQLRCLKSDNEGADSQSNSTTSDSSTTSSSSSSRSSRSSALLTELETKLDKTVSGLDSLLGVDDKSKQARGGPLGADFKASVTAKIAQGGSASPRDDSMVSISPEALGKMVDLLSQGDKDKSTAVQGELTNQFQKPPCVVDLLSQGDKDKISAVQGELTDQFQKVAEKAQKMEREIAKTPSEESNPKSDSSQSNSDSDRMSDREREDLMNEFETLVNMVDRSNDEVMSPNDVKRLKEAAFGPQSFWVTETKPLLDAERKGILIRGNLRTDREKVLQQVSKKVEELFGGKFEVLMVVDERGGPEGSSGSGRMTGVVDRGPAVAFQVVPAAQARPAPTDTLQQALAFVLSLLFVGACVQLGLASNITKLPPETLEWLSNPSNLQGDSLPPGLDSWDPTTYFASAAPIITSLVGANVTHEVGHRAAAFVKKVELGPSFFLPSFQIGSFGAITPFKSLLKNRAAMWDVAAAGPLAGALASAALLGVGLASSDVTQVSPELLIPVPVQLLQGSLLLGTVTKTILGEQALQGAQVLLSPLAIAGWYGLICNALNMLPVGCLDGGRMMQGAFGKRTLGMTAFVSYLALGLGLLGGPLALPFGLYVVLCQRTPERYIKDNVAPAGEGRQAATVAALLVALLILLPMLPDNTGLDVFGADPNDFI